MLSASLQTSHQFLNIPFQSSHSFKLKIFNLFPFVHRAFTDPDWEPFPQSCWFSCQLLFTQLWAAQMQAEGHCSMFLTKPFLSRLRGKLKGALLLNLNKVQVKAGLDQIIWNFRSTHGKTQPYGITRQRADGDWDNIWAEDSEGISSLCMNNWNQLQIKRVELNTKQKGQEITKINQEITNTETMTKTDKLDTDWTKHEYKRSLPHLKQAGNKRHRKQYLNNNTEPKYKDHRTHIIRKMPNISNSKPWIQWSNAFTTSTNHI